MTGRRRHLSGALYPLLIVLLCLSTGLTRAQDPSGRPNHVKRGRTSAKAKAPEPLTVTLTIITHPPQCEIFINGEDRGASNEDGKLVINKLPLGLYSIEARKAGFDTGTSRFDAGPQEPTLVFNLKISIEDQLKLFQSLVDAGKLDGPEEPNALSVAKKISSDFPDRPEAPKLRATLYPLMLNIAETTARATVLDPEKVSADQLNRAHNAATHAVGLVDNDMRARACDMYLEGVREMMAIQSQDNAAAKGEAKINSDSGRPAEQESQAARKSYSDALLKFENAAQIDQSLVPASFQMGQVLLLLNKPVAAQSAFITVTRVQPSWTVAHLGLAMAYLKDAKFAEAAQEYQRAADLDPKSCVAFTGLGIARAAAGESEQGIKDLQTASQLDPTDALPHYDLGLIYSKSKRKKDRAIAIDELTRAIELNKSERDFKNADAEQLITELKGHHKK